MGDAVKMDRVRSTVWISHTSAFEICRLKSIVDRLC